MLRDRRGNAPIPQPLTAAAYAFGSHIGPAAAYNGLYARSR